MLALVAALSVTTSAIMAADIWLAAATLPSWMPAPPHWLARAMYALPFTHAKAWEHAHGLLAGGRALALAPWAVQHVRTQALLSHGSYQGWSDGESGSLVLYGHACSEDDPPVALSLTAAGRTVTVERGAFRTVEADLGTPYAMPLTLIAAHLPPGDYAPSATARCRSGTEAHHALGAVRIVAQPPNGAGLSATLRLAPVVGVAAELVVYNPGPGAVTLRAVEYAPAWAAAGEVLGAAGRREMIYGWREATWPVALPGRGGTEEAELTPWHFAYQAPDDPRALRSRDPRALDLRLRGGEYAFLLLDQRSFRPTRPMRPAIFHPLVRYETETGRLDGVLVREPVAVGWIGQ